jgi:hypothetical protein
MLMCVMLRARSAAYYSRRRGRRSGRRQRRRRRRRQEGDTRHRQGLGSTTALRDGIDKRVYHRKCYAG